MAVFLTICIGISAIVFYLFFQSEIGRKQNKELSNAAYFYAEKLNDTIDEMESICGVISNNYDLQKVIRTEPADEKRMYLQERCDVNGKLALLVQSYTSMPYEVAVILDDGRTFSYAQHSLVKQEDIYNSAWYQKAKKADGIIWEYSDDALAFNSLIVPYMSAQMPIRDIKTNRICGAVNVELSESFFNEELAGIADEDYQIRVLAEEKELFAINGGEVFSQGEKYFVRDTLKNGWILEIRLKTGDPVWFGTPVFLGFLLFLLVLISTFITIDFYCRKSIISPITQLVEAMSKLQIDSLTEPIAIDTTLYEVKYLCKGYNQMLKRIQKLLHNVEQAQVEAQKAQFAVLQAQINPHFLYNTLDTIAWQIRLGETEEAHRNLMDFSRYFRLSLGKGKQMVSLQEELEHTRIYMNLMSVRYLGQIQYSLTSTESNILSCLCPKLILQPIVENSINHGILQKESQSGKVIVTAQKQAENILIEVMDDGIGIELEQLEQINQYLDHGEENLKRQEEQGYGIFNINRRLKLLYGKQYGIRVQSQYGAYTRVNILLPVMMGGKKC